MATANDTMASLINDRNALAAHTGQLSPAAGQYLWTAIDDINNEIDQITASSLLDASYVPQTDPFKSVTNASKQFIGTLHDIKSVFSGAADVLAAADDVIKVILAL